MQTSTLQIRDRLLAGLDKEYNVVNMDIVVDVLSQLETLTITKEALEATRLGKHVNELRRKAQHRHLATRAKSLVKKWRELLLPPTQNRTPPIPTIGEPPPGGGHVGMNGGSKSLVNGNGTTVNKRESSYVNRPSSRLTSPATNAIQGHHNNKSILSPGLRTGVSSSLPSSTSTSPGLSRPTTPLNKHSPPPASIASHPASPPLMPMHQQTSLYGGESVPRHNAANKRLRKEMEQHDSDIKTSLFDVIDGRNNGSSKPPPSKRSKPNGVVSNNQNTSEFLLQNHRDIPINNSFSSPSLQNCDTHSTKATVIPPNRFASSVNGSALLPGTATVPESSSTSTHSVSPQGSSLSPPVNAVIDTPISSSNSAKPPPGKRKTRAQRRSEDERRDDILKQQMQSATRSGILSKVRTTQELVKELNHSRLSSPSLPNARHEPTSHVTDVTQLNETKTELMNRFFDSQTHSTTTNTAAENNVLSPPDSIEARRPTSPDALVNNRSQRSSSMSRSESATPIDGGVGPTHDLVSDGGKETAEDVIARLPPIDKVAILAEMEQEILEEEEEQEEDIEGLIPVKKHEIEITEEMINNYNKQVENVNGNFGYDGEFREWHEVVSKTSAEGDLLHILPYSVID